MMSVILPAVYAGEHLLCSGSLVEDGLLQLGIQGPNITEDNDTVLLLLYESVCIFKDKTSP